MAARTSIDARRDASRRVLLQYLVPTAALLVVGALLVPWLGPVPLLVAAALALGLALLALAGERLALAAVGARPASTDDFPRYHNLVEGLCLDAKLTVPRLLVIDDEAPNALAVGNPQRSALVVTTGLLDRLNLVELEGVLGRQLELIHGHGTRPRTAAVVLGGLAPLLWYRGGAWRPLAWLAAPLVPLQRLLDQRAVDIEADERGALLTRYPPGLINALAKLAERPAQPPAARAVAHLWLVEPARPADEPGWLWSGLRGASVDTRLAELREV